MLKSVVLAICCLAAAPAILPHRAMAQSDSSVIQSTDPVIQSPKQRSPESIERRREREQIRQREAFRAQLEWRRKYGDLAPSRQSPSFDGSGRTSDNNSSDPGR